MNLDLLCADVSPLELVGFTATAEAWDMAVHSAEVGGKAPPDAIESVRALRGMFVELFTSDACFEERQEQMALFNRCSRNARIYWCGA